MDHFSTVLQRPPHFSEDGSSNGTVGEDRGPRGGLRDILNPVSSSTQAPPATPGAPAPPRPAASHPSSSSAFSLRSPTRQPPDYHHPSSYAAASPSSASAAASQQHSGSRSILNNPFGAASAPSLQAPPSAASSTTSTSGLQHPPRSPLHAPPAYYSSDTRDARDRDSSSREKTGGFYDPTTDSNRERERDRDRGRDRERRVSDSGSWRAATQTSPPKVSNQS